MSSSSSSRLTAPLLLLVVLVSIPTALVGALWWQARAQERRNAELQQLLEQQQTQFRLEMGRLLGETKRGEFRVLEQRVEDGETIQRMRFVEFFNEDDPNRAAVEKEFELIGDEIFVDSVLVRFDDEAVRSGKARNFSVFRRVFSDAIPAREGVPLYDVSLRKAREQTVERIEMRRIADADAFVERLIAYLGDPRLASRDGVRFIEGKANYVNPRPGYTYSIIQKAGGDLMIDEQPLAEIDTPTAPGSTPADSSGTTESD